MSLAGGLTLLIVLAALGVLAVLWWDTGPMTALADIRAQVTVHLRRQADAELARDMDAAKAAEADVAWCRAVEVAVAEEVKGESLEEVMARNEKNRAIHAKAVAKAKAR